MESQVTRGGDWTAVVLSVLVALGPAGAMCWAILAFDEANAFRGGAGTPVADSRQSAYAVTALVWFYAFALAALVVACVGHRKGVIWIVVLMLVTCSLGLGLPVRGRSGAPVEVLFPSAEDGPPAGCPGDRPTPGCERG